jgi:hypothetical protein
MKKILVLIAALLFAVVFMGCDTGTNPDSNGGGTTVVWPAALEGTWSGSGITLEFINVVTPPLLVGCGLNKDLESIQGDIYHLVQWFNNTKSEGDYKFVIDPNDGTLTVTKVNGHDFSIPSGPYTKQP